MLRCDITLPRYPSYLEIAFFLLRITSSDQFGVKVWTTCWVTPSKTKQNKWVPFSPEKADSVEDTSLLKRNTRHPGCQQTTWCSANCISSQPLYLNDIGVLQLLQDCNFLSDPAQVRILHPAVLQHPLLPDELYNNLHRQQHSASSAKACLGVSGKLICRKSVSASYYQRHGSNPVWIAQSIFECV